MSGWLYWIYFEYRPNTKRLKLDIKNCKSPPAKPSIEEAPELQLKALPMLLRYVFLGKNETFQVIIAADLNGQQAECLVAVLKRFKRPIVWTIVDIIRIPLGISVA